MNQSSKLLEVVDLHVHYGVIHALKGVSLHVNSGEMVALIGSNGAGKTTLLKALSGVLKPTSGILNLDQQLLPPAQPRQAVQRGLVQVPEGRGIFGNLTVFENLQLGCYLRNDKEQIHKDLEHVYQLFPILTERRSQLAGTLSGGEQQMLAIGRGLMMKPKILLLDEPSLGLAPLMVQKIFSILTQINHEGVTILLVEQNAHQALKSAHRGYVMDTGRIALTGTGNELLGNEEVKRAYLGH